MANDSVRNNEPDNAFKREELYPAIPWILSSITVFGSMVIINYLRSKPLLSQTVMDYANKILFLYSIGNPVLVSFFVTLALVSSDCGEVLVSIIGYTIPASVDIIFVQVSVIFIIQAMMLKNPEYLENSRFENIVRCIVSVVIPLASGIFYTIVYFVAGPTGIYVVL